MMESPVQCGCNAHVAPGFFLWQELPLKHPERMRSPIPRQRSMGIGEFPQQAEKRFRVTKALLAEEWFKLTLVADKSIILTGFLCKNLAN